MLLATSRKTLFTIRSTQRVSQVVNGRGTTTVPMMLAQAVSTSRPPKTAATARAAVGTTIGLSSPVGSPAANLPGTARPR